jgi:hypothetical protein
MPELHMQKAFRLRTGEAGINKLSCGSKVLAPPSCKGAPGPRVRVPGLISRAKPFQMLLLYPLMPLRASPHPPPFQLRIGSLSCGARRITGTGSLRCAAAILSGIRAIHWLSETS